MNDSGCGGVMEQRCPGMHPSTEEDHGIVPQMQVQTVTAALTRSVIVLH
jgi:hypothetical protein